MMTSMKRLLLAAALSLLPFAAAGSDPDPREWSGVLREARGQTVYWNAWAGDPRINDYISWAGEQVAGRHGVQVVHVKLTDTAEAVSRILAEKTGGRTDDGSVDLIWINGENFASMKRNGLLFGPWAEDLPNFPLTAPGDNPAVREDFTIPVEGYEAPWGKAQLVFYHDSAFTVAPPRTMPELLAWARANPGRFTYPLPPNFLGSTFLKQTLLGLAQDQKPLYRPVDPAAFDTVTAPLWAFLDALHPLLWREGKAFPASGPELRRMMGDGEISLAVSFSPSEASAAILNGQLPATVRTSVLDGGTIGNVSFVAIPFNAAHKAGAMVLANFLLSPEAQARKQDPAVWGAATVLALDRLPAADRALFDRLALGPATLPPDALGTILREPHPSWMEELERAWSVRYTSR